MLPGAIERSASGAHGLPLRRAFRWAEPRNVFSRVQTEVASFLGWLGLAIIASLAISTAKVIISLQVQDLQLRISASRALQEKLAGERDALAQRLAELSRPGRIDDAARLELGMMRPVPGQELVIR